MEFVDKKINEALEEELATDENSIRNKTFNSIDRYLVCFISAYRQRDEKGNPVSIETNEKNTQKLSDELREKYGFGYHVHRGYYREENSDIPEYEKSLAVNGYEIHDPQKEKTLIENFRKIMLTLARQYQQDSIILSIPHCGADLIDVKTNTVVLHFNRLTESELSAEFMERRKRDLSKDFAYTSLGYRKDNKDKRDKNISGGDKGRRVRWVVESIDEIEKPKTKSISQGQLFSSYRKKAIMEYNNHFNKLYGGKNEN